MNTGKTVFAQLLDHLPQHQFRRCVNRYKGNYKVQSFTCLDQYLCLFFAQLTYRESLRDITTCLLGMQNKLYHMGIRGTIARSTLADANEKRDWRIYQDFAHILIHHARELYSKDSFGVTLEETTYALDSTTIDLCLALFPWAKFRKHKGAVKMHTLLDLRGNIPSFIAITDGKVHDVNILDLLIIEPGSFYIMDRGYVDFDRLFQIHKAQGFFVIRAKSNLSFRRQYSHSADKSLGVRCDQTIMLTGQEPSVYYPEQLRRIKYADPETGKIYVFLTNNFKLGAKVIADLYKSRWQIELFFKWIKQHLRIKAFYGTSENAVKTQIWSAISVYVLIALAKKKLNLDITLYTFLQILSVSVFEKVDILQLVTNSAGTIESTYTDNQLNLFDL
ncbi:IS4 family transposase [Prosthecochloris sp. CIB 2401]|uniref:IS4 family transposase n=1 Tax=Prosthecochloris sp. CIB 2401 TaxID=1868325 RepID=UPI00080AA065|nr:IS4 family transposase [Prosthecochloris sp. CIB 2401]ANT64826.1 Transposase [Prosthecochloris sp. CIB 2401]ANT65405.1 Transposase [Prosthecochloris sp. CIB 2401]